MATRLAKRTSIDFSEGDLSALATVMHRYGQQSEAGVIRLCLHMVANAKEMLLESPVDTRELGREGQGA